MSARPGEIVVGAFARLPRYRRTLRADRRVLRTSWRVTLVRSKRGIRAALSIPRLEIRRNGTVRRRPVRARRGRLLQKDKVEIVSAGPNRRCVVDLHGKPGTPTAASRMGVRARS